VAESRTGRFLGLAERLTGGRYIDIDINRASPARYGLNVADVQAVVSGAIGGESIGETVEGLARYPISVRYPRELRDSVDKLASLPVLTPSRQQITLGTVADVRISDGPPMLRSENGGRRPGSTSMGAAATWPGWSVTCNGRSPARSRLPPGVSISYTLASSSSWNAPRNV
jgi:Cu(I)/Ag(I) efflux system membrane protein CusA/SilA